MGVSAERRSHFESTPIIDMTFNYCDHSEMYFRDCGDILGEERDN
jgi:hypothetical protein